MRFSSAGSPYRTSLHLPPSVEPRWVTIIYAVPPPSNFLGSVTGGAAYKLLHFIATTGEDLSLLRNTLEGFREGRLARGISDSAMTTTTVEACAPCDDEHKVVREMEVHQLCARLGMGLSAAEISAAFKVRRQIVITPNRQLMVLQTRRRRPSRTTFSTSRPFKLSLSS